MHQSWLRSRATAAVPSAASRPDATGRRLPPHLLFGGLLLAGAVLRVLVIVGYRPAFLFPDSTGYLAVARTLVPNLQRPSGYSLFLHVIPGWERLWPAALVQHGLGLAIAVLLYVALCRRGVPTWGAALATGPVLLDPWQVALEHYMLSDVLFEFLLVVALVLLTWWRRVGWQVAAAAGFTCGLSSTVRAVGVVLVVPAILALLAGIGTRRIACAVALAVAFVLPFGGYLAWFHHAHGQYATSDMGPRFLYGRVAPFADCSGLSLPAYERPLCPREVAGAPPLDARTPDWYVWNHLSPLRTYTPPPGKTLNQVVKDFDQRILRHQPLSYARVVTVDFLRGFQPTRAQGPKSVSSVRTYWWQLPKRYPVHHNRIVKAMIRKYDVHPRVRHGLAGALSAYGRHVYVPGVLLGAGLLAGIVATLGIGRARRTGLRAVTGLYVGTALVVLATAAATVTFSWRYQMQQLVLIPPAAALALTALLRRPAAPDSVAMTEHSGGHLPWTRS